MTNLIGMAMDLNVKELRGYPGELHNLHWIQGTFAAPKDDPLKLESSKMRSRLCENQDFEGKKDLTIDNHCCSFSVAVGFGGPLHRHISMAAIGWKWKNWECTGGARTLLWIRGTSTSPHPDPLVHRNCPVNLLDHGCPLEIILTNIMLLG